MERPSYGAGFIGLAGAGAAAVTSFAVADKLNAVGAAVGYIVALLIAGAGMALRQHEHDQHERAHQIEKEREEQKREAEKERDEQKRTDAYLSETIKCPMCGVHRPRRNFLSTYGFAPHICENCWKIHTSGPGTLEDARRAFTKAPPK